MAEESLPPGGDSPWVTYARFAGIGFETAFTIVLSIFVGARLDAKIGSSPLFLIIFLIIGFAVSVSIIIKYSKQADKDMKGGEEDGNER